MSVKYYHHIPETEICSFLSIKLLWKKLLILFYFLLSNCVWQFISIGSLDPLTPVTSRPKKIIFLQTLRNYFDKLWQIGAETVSEALFVLRCVIQDAIELHLNMISKETLLVLAITIPLHYLCMYDRIQETKNQISLKKENNLFLVTSHNFLSFVHS